MTTLADALTRLHQEARPDQLTGMAHYGMVVDNRLGLSMPTIRRIGKELGCDHPLALALWSTGLAEARIVASIIADPRQVDGELMDTWVKDFNSWDAQYRQA